MVAGDTEPVVGVTPDMVGSDALAHMDQFTVAPLLVSSCRNLYHVFVDTVTPVSVASRAAPVDVWIFHVVSPVG